MEIYDIIRCGLMGFIILILSPIIIPGLLIYKMIELANE